MSLLDDRLDAIDAQMAGLLPEEEGEQGFFSKWVKRPVFSAFGKAQNLLVEPVLGETEAYKQAAEELQQATGREEGAWEALPGLGDVAVQGLMSPEARDSIPGRVAEPLLRLAGNAVADPSNYVGGFLLKGAAKGASKAIGKGLAVKAGEAVASLPKVAELVPGALGPGMDDIARASIEQIASGLRNPNRLEQIKATKNLIEASGDVGALKTYDLLSKVGLGTDISMMGAAAVAGAPDIAMGVGGAAKKAWESFEQGEYGKAGADLTSGILMAGLGGLMVKGSLDSYEAARVFQNHVGAKTPELASKLATEASNAAQAEAVVAPRPFVNQFQMGDHTPRPTYPGLVTETGFEQRPYYGPRTVPVEPEPTGFESAPFYKPVSLEQLAAIREGVPEPGGQLPLPGMARIEPPVEPAAPPVRAPRKKRAKQTELAVGQEPVLTKTQRQAQQVTEAMNDPDVPGLIEARIRARMSNDLMELRRSGKTEGLAALRRLFESKDESNPEYVKWVNEHKPAAVAELQTLYKRMAKQGLNPAEQLRIAREQRLEREGIQGEVDAPIVSEPAPWDNPQQDQEPVAPGQVDNPVEPLVAEPLTGGDNTNITNSALGRENIVEPPVTEAAPPQAPVPAAPEPARGDVVVEDPTVGFEGSIRKWLGVSDEPGATFPKWTTKGADEFLSDPERSSLVDRVIDHHKLTYPAKGPINVSAEVIPQSHLRAVLNRALGGRRAADRIKQAREEGRNLAEQAEQKGKKGKTKVGSSAYQINRLEGMGNRGTEMRAKAEDRPPLTQAEIEAKAIEDAALEEFSDWAIGPKGNNRVTTLLRNTGVTNDDAANDIIQMVVVRMMQSPHWKGLATKDEKVGALKAYIPLMRKKYFEKKPFATVGQKAERAARKAAQAGEEVKDTGTKVRTFRTERLVEGADDEVVPKTPSALTINPIEGLSPEAAEAGLQRFEAVDVEGGGLTAAGAERTRQAAVDTKDFAAKMAWAQKQAKQKFEKGDTSIVNHLESLSDPEIRRLAEQAGRAGEKPETVRTRVAALFQIYQKHGEIPADVVIEKAAGMGLRLDKPMVSRYKKMLLYLLDNDQRLKLPKDAVERGFDAPASKIELKAKQAEAKQRAQELRGAESILGIKSTDTVKVGVARTRGPGAAPARKGREAESGLQSLYGDNGVRIDVARGDSPLNLLTTREGSRVTLDPKTGEVRPNYTTVLQLVNVGGKADRTPEEIAEVLRETLKGNPSVRSLSVALNQLGGTGTHWAISPAMEKALGILEREGLIHPRNTATALKGQAAPTVIGKTAKPGAVPRVAPEVRKPTAEEIAAYQKQVKQATGKEPTAGFAEARLISKLEDEALGAKTRAEAVLLRQDALAEAWVEEQLRGGTKTKPVARLYGVGPKPGTAEARPRITPIEILGDLREISDEHLPSSAVDLREAHDNDMLDAALVHEGMRSPNIDGAHDAETHLKLTAAHKPIYQTLERISNEVSKALGLGTKFAGVLVSPWRHGLIAGDDLRLGEVYLSPMGALYRAVAEGKGIEEAARKVVYDQLFHEVSHALDDSVAHGADELPLGYAGVVKKLEALFEGQGDLFGGSKLVDRWVKELSDEKLWKEIEAASGDYNAVVERIKSGQRESWRGSEEGVGGVRTGAAEGGAAPLPNRLPQGEAGAQAGGGPRLRPGEALSDGGRNQTRAVGEAAVGGRGDGQGGDGGGAGRVAGGSEGGRRRVASYAPKLTLDEARREVDKLSSRPGDATELRRDAHNLSHGLMQHLKANLSDPKVKAEWERRANAKPTGSGETHSRINAVWQQLSDDAKVSFQIYSQISEANPELRKEYLVSRPYTFNQLDADMRQVLNLKSPEELIRKYEKGLKLSHAEKYALRTIAVDVQKNYDDAAMRMDAAQLEYDSMSAGSVKDKFFEEKLQPAKDGWAEASSKMARVDATINDGTEWGRDGAYRRIVALASDPEQQQVMALKEGVREALSARYKNKSELTDVVNKLASEYDRLRRQADWSTVGVKEWVDQYRAAHKFGMIDKFLQFYKAGLLGYTSRVANIGSNTIFVNGIRKVENDVAAMLEQGWAKMKGQTPEGFADEFMLSRAISQRALREALPVWARSQRDAFALKPLDYTQSREFVDDLVKMPSAIGGKFGEFVSFMFKGMNSDDAFYKHYVKVDHYNRRIYRNVVNKVAGFEIRPGETKWEATERLVGEMTQNIHDMYDKGQKMDDRFSGIHEDAQKLALKDTYQEELPGVAKSLQQALYSGGGRAFQIPIPFVKTPFNIAKQVLQRTPVIGWGMDAVKWKEMSHAQKVDATSKHLLSGMVAAGLYSMIDPEKISGAGPIDPEANMLKRATGWAPYSIKIGDTWHSYSRLEPFSSLIGMLADTIEGQQQGDFDKFTTGMTRVLGSVAENITNKTFLSGLENLSNALSDPLRYAEDWLKRTESSFVPNTIGFLPYGHLAQTLDPVYREVDVNPVNVFKSKTPGLSQTLDPQFSPTGEIRKRPDTLGPRFLSPFVTTTEKRDPVSRAAGMLSDINYPMRRIRSEMDYKGIRVKLTSEEQQRLAKAQNEAMAFIGKRLINDPTFKALPDNEDMAEFPGQKTKKDVIAKIMRRYRNPVVNALNPLLRQRAAEHLKGRVDAGA